MRKKFEINRTKIKGGFQSGRKMVTHNSKSYLPLALLVIAIAQWDLNKEIGVISLDLNILTLHLQLS